MIGDTLVPRQNRLRLILSAVLVVGLAWFFWTQSRYPSLDEKAMMSGAIQLEDPLSFEAMIPITEDMGTVERVGASTLNWIDTNKKGMTFGLLFGAAFLTLLGYLRRQSFSGPFANSLYGMFLGAPLGVCVNCAAPIAKGLYQGGSRAETTLSAMIASPTLNIVVMTMAFSLLPFYLALTKLVLSLLVILVGVPLLCRLLPEEKLLRTVGKDGDHAGPAAPAATREPEPLTETPEAPLDALKGFALDFGRNLIFILKTTLPLMLLAGFLGALVATFLPPELLANREFGILGALFASIVGTFLPVPIGFDVVVSGALLNGGINHGYIMILVFTLGSFSVYSFMIVGGAIGWRAAGLLAAMIMSIGLLAGLGAHLFHGWQTDRAVRLLTEDVVAQAVMEPDPLAQSAGVALTSPVIAPTVDPNVVLSVESRPFTEQVEPGEPGFDRREAWQDGIDHPLEFSFTDMWPPFWEGRSIATGDVDRDGDLDVVFASTRAGVYVYTNDGSGQFERQALDLAGVEQLPVFNAVLADLDNDGWPDLFLTTYREGLFRVPNRSGVFDFAARQPVRNREDAYLVLATSLADIDRDGDLDAVLGNWAAGWYRRIPGEESRNRIIFNAETGLDGSVYTDLPGIPGESLTTLFTDLDGDGASDLLVGNDFEIPDYVYFGDGAGGFEMVTPDQGQVPMSTTTTMSLTTADLTNDGQLEIYAAQIAGRASGISDRLHMRPIARYCETLERESDRATCQLNIDIKAWYRPGNSLDPSQASRCADLDEPYRSECRGMLMKDLAIQNNNPVMCDLVPVDQTLARAYCRVHFQPTRPFTRADREGAIPQILQRNVLLERTQGRTYSESAEARGVEVGGWSWNVSMADLDHNGWQDIYIVNGTWVPNEVTPSNIFLANTGNGPFEARTFEMGLDDYLMTAATGVFDMDGDGDLDIITVPVNAPPVVFENRIGGEGVIILALRDEVGNRDGIGARIELHDPATGEMQMREIQLGGGFMSFNAPWAHFAFAEARTGLEARIRWADGTLSMVETPLSTGQFYQITRRPDEAAPTIP